MRHDQEAMGSSKPAETEEGPVSFGVKMRMAREEAGFTIERVAMATRISAPFIEALETEQLDRLPGVIFGRGFIRNICKAYGKDPQGFLVAFDVLCQKEPAKYPYHAHRDEKRHQQLQKGVLLIPPNEWKNRLKTLAPHHYLRAKPLIGLLLALVLGVSVVQIVQETEESASPVAITESAPVAPEAPESQSLPAQSESTVQQALLDPLAVQPEVATPPPAAPSQLEVELRVKTPVAVTYTKDAEPQVAETLQVQTYKYPFQEQFKLYVENAAHVEIYFKGQRVGGANAKAEPRRFTFAAAEQDLAKRPEVPRL